VSRDVSTFLLRGLLYFLLLELLFLPLRESITALISPLIPEGFSVGWECTALDEVFLFVAFVLAFPSEKNKLPVILVGVFLIELYNIIRIIVLVNRPDPFLHELLFRWGGFLLVLLLFYASFRYLRSGVSRR